jgi:hypothetical protein
MTAPVKTGAVINVEVVDARGFDPDENFAASRFGIGNLFVAEHFRPAELVNADGFHGA